MAGIHEALVLRKVPEAACRLCHCRLYVWLRLAKGVLLQEPLDLSLQLRHTACKRQLLSIVKQCTCGSANTRNTAPAQMVCSNRVLNGR